MSHAQKDQEQSDREAHLDEVRRMLNVIGTDSSVITREHWMEAFKMLNTPERGVVTRKAWYLKHGSTHVFDSVGRMFSNSPSSRQCTVEEWAQAFEVLADGEGVVSVTAIPSLCEPVETGPAPSVPTPHAPTAEDSQADVDSAQPAAGHIGKKNGRTRQRVSQHRAALCARLEQNEDPLAELIHVMKVRGPGGSLVITENDWMDAFKLVDLKKVGVITRKAWYLKHDSTYVFDSIRPFFWNRSSSRQCTALEWKWAFKVLDTDNKGFVSVTAWLLELERVQEDGAGSESAASSRAAPSQAPRRASLEAWDWVSRLPPGLAHPVSPDPSSPAYATATTLREDDQRRTEAEAANPHPAQCSQLGASSEKPWTTVILRGLPDDMERETFLQLLDTNGFAGKYDFAYLPTSVNTLAALGDAIVNMLTHEDAQSLLEWGASSTAGGAQWFETCQGLLALFEECRDKDMMRENFVPFPSPTKKIKAPKLLKGKA